MRGKPAQQAAQGGEPTRAPSCKRDHVLLSNSTTSLHTILLVIIFANGPPNVAGFTMGRSPATPRATAWLRPAWPGLAGLWKVKPTCPMS